MTTWDVSSVAEELLRCEAERRDRDKFTDEWPELDLATGYEIQTETLRRRLARGESITGVKLGLTSKAKQERMGVDTPLVAWVTDTMVLAPGDSVPQAALIHPRLEPEIVFVMKDRLEGPGVTAEDALQAVGRVHGGAEVIDSRYRDFKFTAADVVADNASSGAYVLGDESFAVDEIDLVAEAVDVVVDGEVVHSGTGGDVLGHPAAALALAVNDLAARGLAIEPGWVVLTGGITDAVHTPPGAVVEMRFSTLGTVRVEGGED